MPEYDPLEAFEEADVVYAVTRELKEGSVRYNKNTHPIALLLAGQPGAGKTELSTMLSREMQNDVMLINGDDYRRLHPNYKALYKKYGADAVQKTSAYSSAVTEMLIEQASNRRYNLIIEGTGRTADIPRSTAEKLSAKGYRVELAVIATMPEISLISTWLRFVRMSERGTIPRVTATAAHDHIVSTLPDNLDILKNCPAIAQINIWDRELHRLYGNGNDVFPPSLVLRQYWNRPWSTDELQSARYAIEAIQQRGERMKVSISDAVSEMNRRLDQVKVCRTTIARDAYER